MALSKKELEELKEAIAEATDLRVKPKDGKYGDLGRKVIEWATKQNKQPKLGPGGVVVDVDKLRKELEPYFDNLPTHIKRVIFVQPGPDEYYIRLPAERLVGLSRRIFDLLDKASKKQREEIHYYYPIPGFYKERYESGGTKPSDGELLDARVGDYTFAHCA